jgi:hypothetical protein
VCHLHMARKLCSILLDTWPHRSAREWGHQCSC